MPVFLAHANSAKQKCSSRRARSNATKRYRHYTDEILKKKNRINVDAVWQETRRYTHEIQGKNKAETGTSILRGNPLGFHRSLCNKEISAFLFKILSPPRMFVNCIILFFYSVILKKREFTFCCSCLLKFLSCKSILELCKER
jgi:hypothetical protein